MGGKKAFISHVDSHLGKVMCKRFAQAEYEVIGTSSEAGTKSAKWANVVSLSNVEQLKKHLMESDVVVYQLEDSVDEATSALKVLMNGHFEVEKTFILISSTMTWYETEAASLAEKVEDPEEDPEEEAEEKEQPTYTEEEYTKRVPHVKYQLWKELEKLCKKANSETLHTHCIFAGLQYGMGEDKLHPIFKQAWHLSDQGLPIFDKGANMVPMVHVQDLSSLAFRLGTAESPLDQRYFLAADEGNSTWKDIIKAVNTHLGNGKCFTVPRHDLVLYENVEYFIINLKLELGKMGELLEEDEWVSRSGFVENAAKVVEEFKRERQIQPLRAAVLGPPMSGKSFFSREIASHYRVPCFNIYDVIKDYEQQDRQLSDELQRLKFVQKQVKTREKLQELRQKRIEAAAAEAEPDAEAEAKEDDAQEDKLKEDESDDEIFDDDLLAELERLGKEEGGEEEEPEETEEMAAVKEQLGVVSRVLALREKEAKDEELESANPKDKKKDKGKPAAPPPADEDQAKAPLRYSDRALAFMVQWKLRQPQCRNQGYILDGYPKTVRQARYLLEEGQPGEYPAEGAEDEEEPALEDEKKPMDDIFFPEYLVHLKASDTFLTERLLKVANQHPHNSPAEFQQRLEFYKTHNPPRDRVEPTKDASKGLIAFLESSLTITERALLYRQFDVESTPLLPPPPPESAYEKRPSDKVFLTMCDFIGAAHNYGPTPQALSEEQALQKALEDEQRTKRERQEQTRRTEEQRQKAHLEQLERAEANRIAELKGQEREMLEARKEPLKQYLMANIIPVLTKGIVEVCEQRPEDPIDFLADWLFRHNPMDDETGV